MIKRIDDTNKSIIKQLQDGRKPFSAIAEELGITENTVRARVNNAIANFARGRTTVLVWYSVSTL